MTFEGTRRPALVGVLLLAFGVTAVVTNVAGLGLAHAAQSNEVAVTMQIESSGGEPVMEMQYWLGPDRLRMDVPQGASVIWFGGSQPRMLMVQHAERRYIEWGTPQLDMMRRMMQGMKQMPEHQRVRSLAAQVRGDRSARADRGVGRVRGSHDWSAARPDRRTVVDE